MSEELAFLGVDFSTHRQAQSGKTQVAWGIGHEQGVHITALESPRDDQALQVILCRPYTCCGVDAPLSLPPCVLCRELPCECPFERWMELLQQPVGACYHYRLSDVLVRKTVPGVAPKPGLSNGGPVDITPLTLRWQRLARKMVGEGADLTRVVEVYATGAIQLYAQAAGLVVPGQVFRYRASLEARAALLTFLGRVGRLTVVDVLWDQLIHSEDAFDASMAALVAWHAHFRSVLLPEMMLGLNSYQREDLLPLDDLSKDERLAMQRCLQRAPWVMLPDTASLALASNEEHVVERGDGSSST